MGLTVVLFPAQHDIPHVGIWIDLAVLGTVTGVAQIFLKSSYYYADAVTVASMRYIQIPLSGVLGYVLFSEMMTYAEIMGATIIVLSCCVIGWREFIYKSCAKE
ncbi:MAG: DMT family transporter [Paracoccaceae bacterium]|nr:DMT family transporter [Paracoccaceae bacterium]